MKDTFGRPINIGDMIAFEHYLGQDYRIMVIGTVTKLDEKYVTVKGHYTKSMYSTLARDCVLVVPPDKSK
jgi:hypothetical protein